MVVNSLRHVGEVIIEKGIMNIKLMDRPMRRDGNGMYKVNGSRTNNGTKSVKKLISFIWL
jgi:hypothetical protein